MCLGYWTEGLEVKEQSLVGNGNAISAQIFHNTDADSVIKPQFHDNFGEGKDLLIEFKEVLRASC